MTRPTEADIKEVAFHAELDKRLVAAVRGIRLLESVSWPATEQPKFLESWHAGNPQMPRIIYPKFDFTEIRHEIDSVAAVLRSLMS